VLNIILISEKDPPLHTHTHTQRERERERERETHADTFPNQSEEKKFDLCSFIHVGLIYHDKLPFL